MTEPQPQQLATELEDLTCQQITAFLVDYVTEEMAPARRAAFEAHLRDCLDCVAFLQTYTHTIRASRAIRTEEVPGEMLNRVQQFLRTKINDARPK